MEQLDAGTAAGDLSIVLPAGDLGAVLRPAAVDGDVAAAERARLERELAEAEGWLDAARARLSNDAFISKAPRGGRRDRPRPRGRAHRPGRPTAGATGPLGPGSLRPLGGSPLAAQRAECRAARWEEDHPAAV